MSNRAVYIFGRDFSGHIRELFTTFAAGLISFLSWLYSSLQNEPYFWTNASSLAAVLTCIISATVFVLKMIALIDKTESLEQKARKESMQEAMRDLVDESEKQEQILRQVDLYTELRRREAAKKTDSLEWSEKSEGYRITNRQKGEDADEE